MYILVTNVLLKANLYFQKIFIIFQ